MKRKKITAFLTDTRGFTLIEMAIVLIIIGIIIGAVVKGKDLIRGAEQKKIYTKYINSWRIVYLTFYDRTGKILGDTWDTSLATPAAGQDGSADTAAGTSATTPTAAGQADLYDGPASGTAYMGLKQAGLSAPATNATTNYEYKYIDSEGAAHVMEISFKYDSTSKYNYMFIAEIPNELGIALDTMIDGEADGAADDFLCFNVADAANSAWGAVAGLTDPTDEVSARWKMEF